MTKTCIQEGCIKLPSYGKIGGSRKDAEYCVIHKRITDSDLIHKKCLFQNCKTRPTFGKIGEKSEYCAKHKLSGYVNVVSKTCIQEGCKIQPTFGVLGGTKKDAKYCAKHKLPGYVNVVSKTCIFEGCKTIPTFGVLGGTKKDAKYCIKHKLSGYIDVVNKTCIFEGCKTIPTFGIGKKAEYCAKHKLSGYIDIISKTCIQEGCEIQANFGKIGEKAEYCTNHKLSGYVNVVSKTCIFKGCKTIPTFGVLGGTKKDAKYCIKHKLSDYVNVINKTCIQEGCTTRPTYGELFKDKIHCAKHKKSNEYAKNNPVCEYCKQHAYYTNDGSNYPKRCEDHKEKDDTNIIEKPCIKCGLSYFLNQQSLCNDCDAYFNQKITERKEILIRKQLETKFEKWITADKIPDGSCLKYRPDLVWDFGTHMCITDIDENQHKSYTCECEQARMINLTQDYGGMPVVWIRFNPDNYIDKYGKKFASNFTNRISVLVKVLNSVKIHKPKTLCSAIYLYYDGFDEKSIDIEEINLSSIGI